MVWLYSLGFLGVVLAGSLLLYYRSNKETNLDGISIGWFIMRMVTGIFPAGLDDPANKIGLEKPTRRRVK